jgi:hypothetical protein
MDIAPGVTNVPQAKRAERPMGIIGTQYDLCIPNSTEASPSCLHISLTRARLPQIKRPMQTLDYGCDFGCRDVPWPDEHKEFLATSIPALATLYRL